MLLVKKRCKKPASDIGAMPSLDISLETEVLGMGFVFCLVSQLLSQVSVWQKFYHSVLKKN